MKAVGAFATEMEGKPVDLQPWDWSFYADKLKDDRYGVNDEMTRPYFELEHVKKGVFGLATSLYGLQFVPNPDIQVYHPRWRHSTSSMKKDNSFPCSIRFPPARRKTLRRLDVLL